MPGKCVKLSIILAWNVIVMSLIVFGFGLAACMVIGAMTGNLIHEVMKETE